MSTTKERQRRRFGNAFGELLALRGMSQTAFAARLGTSQSMVSAWIAGDYACSNEQVFAIEKALKVQPGTLSQHLGFLPPEAVAARLASVEEAVMADALLGPDSKRALIGLYGVLVTGDPAVAAIPRRRTPAVQPTARRRARVAAV